MEGVLQWEMILKNPLVYRQHKVIGIHVNYSLIREHAWAQHVHLQTTQYQKK